MKQNTNQNMKQNTNLDNNYEKQTKTNVMILEKLKIEYKIQLTAYKQAVSNYVNFLQEKTNDITDTTKTPSYSVVKGQSFWGNGQAGSESVYTGGTIEECKAKCAETTNCTGATFNPSAHGKPMCWLRTGDGELMPALSTDFAIIPEAKKYLLVIESINSKLLETNKKIQDIIKKGEPLYKSIKIKSQSKNDELLQNYQELVIEREKIEKMLETYEDLDKREINGNLKINQKYYTYVLLSIVTVCIIILLYKISSLFSNPENSGLNYIQQGGKANNAFGISGSIIVITIILLLYFTNIAHYY